MARTTASSSVRWSSPRGTTSVTRTRTSLRLDWWETATSGMRSGMYRSRSSTAARRVPLFSEA